MVAAYPGPARPRSRSAALSEQDLFIFFKQSKLRGSKEGFEDRAFRLLASCRDSVEVGEQVSAPVEKEGQREERS